MGCNIILISVDSLRSDHLGIYGYFRNTSPNIDRFAEEAIIFKNAFAQSYWTLPCHASIFTSRYPSVHGAIDKSRKLDSSEITLAEVLRDNGYRTLAFTGDGYVSSVFGFSQGFDIFIEDELSLAGNIKSALKWIELNKDKKFFIFLHGYEVHSLPMAPRQFLSRYVDPKYNGIAKSFNLDWSEDSHNIYNYTYSLNNMSFLLNKSDIEYIIDCYDGGVNYIDYNIGELIDELKKLNLDKKTIVIITSDHGQALMEHGYIGAHQDIYDEVIHVPLIIKIPNLSFKRVIENQVRSIDIMPTILDLVGLNIPNTVQGKSLLPLIRGDINLSLPVFSEKEDAIAIRMDGFKYIWRASGKHELYNLTSDPKEQINIIDKYPNLGKIFQNEIERFIKTNKSNALNNSEISEEEVKKIESRLKELGYT
jgi:arylsulfatase A-like enzyme